MIVGTRGIDVVRDVVIGMSDGLSGPLAIAAGPFGQWTVDRHAGLG